MKVNISGRGRVPGIGTLAPVRGYDASKEFVLRLLNYKQFKVYDAASGGLITKTNVDKLFAPKVETPAVEAVKKPATKKTVKKEEVAETPKSEPTISEPVEVAPEVTAEEVSQSFIEDVEAVSDQLPTAEELKEEYHPNVTVTEVPIGVDLAQNSDTVIETAVKIPVEEEAPADEDVSVDEEKPAYYSKKKNKKNRNRNNNNE